MYRIRNLSKSFSLSRFNNNQKYQFHYKKLSALQSTNRQTIFSFLPIRNIQSSSIPANLLIQNVSSSCSAGNITDQQQQQKFQIGQRLHGYRVESIRSVPELCLTAYRLIYEKNGAEHLHIERDDSNNVFGVTFRTTPDDSTGVAHILEHLALCGSKRYPVRDPFMKMLQRSLSTFMNAFTGCDYTMYPFSTQNQKDFYNLMSIYLDAVFYPRLRYLDFLQEGWRLEYSNVNDDKSSLIFKGVVFNEMKGVFSSPSSIYTRQMINKLFPDNTYRNESGGDPLSIPDLTYEQLKQFHSRHYHPSNARFFTYGNFPLEKHLQAIGKVIEQFDSNESLKEQSRIPEQNSWLQYQRVKLRCQNDPLAPFPDRQTTASVAWMLKSLQDIQENFTLSILCTLLMDGPNSPFYQALIDSGLGSDYSPFSGYHNFTKQSLFSIGLQGISEDQCNTVMKAIDMALMDAYTDGFPQERIDAILHRIELSTKHQGSNFGLGLLMYINSSWIHDVDPIECLNINKQVEQFKENLQSDSKYLQKKIKQYFLDNKHRLLIEMSPDPDYENQLQNHEQSILNMKISQLSNKDHEEILKNSQELLKLQNQQEDVSILPTLTIQDINRTILKTNLENIRIGMIPIQYSTQPTNGIVYFNTVIQLKPEIFPKKLVPYLPLFAQVLCKLGAGRLDRKQLDQKIQMHTGGLTSLVHIADNPKTFDQFETGIYLGSYCLERNLEQMFELWTEIFNGIRFNDDPDHLMQLIRICSAELAQGVPHQGHQYAMRRASSFFGGAYKFRELTNGISSLAYFRLMAASQDKVREIIKHLEQIAGICFQSDSIRCAINAEAVTMRTSLQILEKFINSFEHSSTANKSSSTTTMNNDEPTAIDFVMPTIQSNSMNEHFIFPFSTNYLGRSLYCIPYTHNDHAKLRIASSLVSMKFLHKEIREKGGAYGGGSRLDNGGMFQFYSYRDPHINETINAFEQTGEWLIRSKNFDDNEIDEAKLQIFQSIDQPIPPGEQGIEQFLTGITDQLRQEYRYRLLDVTRQDIQEVAEKYLIGKNLSDSKVVVLGPKSNETSSNDKQWKIRIASGE
uniref:Presequence protease, mitochondrial n=1 Tax=Dermatophagoides pteronyssinus TaxID=6956 RepID=A0A6P6YAQ0_DERPT|nr:presequence protease, mitochondrial-like [Dermatophagoides pteronyssinus]